jgi:SET domain-containing protein
MSQTKELLDTVWAKIAQSPIHGIGVFAIRDIPKGTEINKNDQELYSLTLSEIKNLPEEIKSLILDRTIFIKETKLHNFYSPNYDAKLQAFMNHSDTPNSDGIYAIRNILKGEEITEDYNTIQSQELHDISKQHYYFL